MIRVWSILFKFDIVKNELLTEIWAYELLMKFLEDV